MEQVALHRNLTMIFDHLNMEVFVHCQSDIFSQGYECEKSSVP